MVRFYNPAMELQSCLTPYGVLHFVAEMGANPCFLIVSNEIKLILNGLQEVNDVPVNLLQSKITQLSEHANQD